MIPPFSIRYKYTKKEPQQTKSDLQITFTVALYSNFFLPLFILQTYNCACNLSHKCPGMSICRKGHRIIQDQNICHSVLCNKL